MSRKDDLCAAEEAAWVEFHGLVESLPNDRATEPGYNGEWSVKDLMAHVACWSAEAAHVLQAIRLAIHEPPTYDVDQRNREFYEACKDLDLDAVRVQLHSARLRMLQELDLLPEDLLNDTAAGWFHENGAAHYQEHLPRLVEWVGELTAG